MARPRGLIPVVCQNEKCTYYRKEKGKNIIKRAKNTAGHQRYFCFHCNTYFVETKGTPLYNKKLSEQKIKSICKELVEKKGIRAIERTHHIHRDTIGRLLDDLAVHAKQFSEYLVHDLKLTEFEVDEFWSFIKKTRKSMSSQARIGLSKVNSGHTPA